jgi:hypothetical protein
VSATARPRCGACEICCHDPVSTTPKRLLVASLRFLTLVLTSSASEIHQPLPPPDGMGPTSGAQLASLGDWGDKGRPRPCATAVRRGRNW